MSEYGFDPDNWLVSTTRVIGAYFADTLNDPDTDLEMSYPDTRTWTKQTPLAKSLIHFEQDAIADPVIGFDIPGVLVVDEDAETATLHEASQHLINYDVGVWTSAETGGVTKRMELVQALKNICTTASGKQAFNEATEGLWIVSFEGGRNELDRINDVPVWRALDMTMVVRVFGRHIPSTPGDLTGDIVQNQDLTIQSPTGDDEPVETP